MFRVVRTLAVLAVLGLGAAWIMRAIRRSMGIPADSGGIVDQVVDLTEAAVGAAAGVVQEVIDEARSSDGL